MRTFFLISLLFSLLTTTSFAQAPQDLTNQDLAKRVAELQARVQQLEAENQALRSTISVFSFVQQAAGGHRVEVQRDGKTLATLVVAREGWGASAEDVAAVAESVAREIFSVIPPVDTPTILLMRSEHGPRALTGRGPNGEYIVLLNSGDRLWAQVAYQLAHELGHVLCRDLRPSAPQQWFEESFCEAMSIWTMEQMAESWKTAAPYPNWSSYAEHLQKYADDVRAGVNKPESMSAWYASQRNYLDSTTTDREQNRILAEEIVTRALERPEFLRAFLYLRTTEPAANTMEAVLQAWAESCPADLKQVPKEMATLLGVTIAE